MRSTLTSAVKPASALNHTKNILRSIQTAAAAPATARRTEGDISSIFSSLNGTVQQPLPQRFADLKTRLIAGREEAVQNAWRALLPRLKREIGEIRELGPAIVPEIEFADIAKGGGTDEAFERRLKRTGVAVVRGVVREEEALDWKEEIREYIRKNPQTKAFPPDDPQVYELYWSPSQLKARAHPNLLATQSFLMSFWHSISPSAVLSTAHPVSYCDRLRIRNPGDNRFALGPHSDGGSVERWEEDGYGLGGVYDAIFAGDIDGYDPWESSGRLKVVSDKYQGPGACSMFRMFQAWLSMSHTGPGEGTLLVNPLLVHATAYFLLRPFFEAKQGRDVLGREAYLDMENWVLKREQDSSLQGAYPGQCLELNDDLHPHLELGSSMVNVPTVRPGDYVVWHCDTIHAVDKSHQGASDSSVLYIPATPLTEANARYLAIQRAHFLQGIPPPDFPGGVGEAGHVGCAGLEELDGESVVARRAMGMERWEVRGSEAQRRVVERANGVLGF